MYVVKIVHLQDDAGVQNPFSINYLCELKFSSIMNRRAILIHLGIVDDREDEDLSDYPC